MCLLWNSNSFLCFLCCSFRRSSNTLGLFNLLPIPGLDGSRILFLIVEGIRRKPVPQKIEAYIHLTGYVMLFGLLIVMTYKDILKIFR